MKKKLLYVLSLSLIGVLASCTNNPENSSGNLRWLVSSWQLLKISARDLSCKLFPFIVMLAF